MADDGEEKEDGFDPWADIDAEGGGDLSGGFSFSFDEASLDDGLSAEPEPAAADAADPHAGPEAASGDDRAAESHAEAVDDLVNAWLDDPADEAPAGQTLAVFAPDEPGDVEFTEDESAAVDQGADSAIRIGTGESGIDSESGVDVESGIGTLGILADDHEQAVDEAEAESLSFVPAEPDDADRSDAADASAFDSADVIDFGAAATAAAGAAGAMAADAGVRKSQPVRRARGGLGPLVGIVLGGLLAIPIVLGILIGLMWMGVRDTVGIRRWMPPQCAFLLPPPPVARMPEPAVASAMAPATTLDDLPTVDAVAVDEAGDSAAAEEAMGGGEGADGEVAATGEPAMDGLLAEPAADADEALAAQVAASVPMAPGSGDQQAMESAHPADALPAEPTPPPVAVVPDALPPLDVSALDAAVGDAATAFEAVAAAGDATGTVRHALLVDWYRNLSRVAGELATVERLAADSGRPLQQTPRQVSELHARTLAAPERLGDLARLARNWLAYSKRDGDGVVVPVTFAGARSVGPYWCSRVTMAEAGGRSRELAVISRSEPAALPGDVLLVTGLALDGNVVWASDLRSTRSDAAGETPSGSEADRGSEPDGGVEADPFGLSEP